MPKDSWVILYRYGTGKGTDGVTRYHLPQSFFLRLEDKISLVVSPLSYKRKENAAGKSLWKLAELTVEN